MNKKKVSILLRNGFSKDSRVIKESVSLSKHFDVTVIAMMKPGLKEKEIFNEVKVVRLNLLPAFMRNIKKKNIFIHVYMFLVFILKSIYFSRGSKFVHCNDLEMLPIGVLIKLLSFGKSKVVYDAHELELERWHIANNRIKFLYAFFERICIRFADKVITVSPSIAEEYKRMYDLQEVKLVMNTPHKQEVSKNDKFRELFNIPSDGFIFLYQGGLSHGRNIERLLETFARLENTKHYLVMMGSGAKESLVKEFAANYSNIFFKDAVAPDELLDFTSSADVGLCILEGICKNHEYALPNKLFEFFTAGLPVMCSNFKDISQLVTQYNVGKYCQWDCIESMKDCVESFTSKDEIEQLGTNTKEIVSRYNWSNQEKELLSAYGI